MNHAQRAYPRIYPWLDKNYVLLAFESADELSDQDIGILPYVLGPGCDGASSERDLLYSFCGTLTHPHLPLGHIRGKWRFERLKGRKQDSFVGNEPDAIRLYGKERGNFRAVMRRSVFTLCPAGYGRWTYRLAEALMCNSIPVLMSDGYIKPFEPFIPWKDMVIDYPEKDFRKVGDFIRQIDKKTIARYQSNIQKYSHLCTEEYLNGFMLAELSKRVMAQAGAANK
jgi:hypothetical protein